VELSLSQKLTVSVPRIAHQLSNCNPVKARSGSQRKSAEKNGVFRTWIQQANYDLKLSLKRYLLHWLKLKKGKHISTSALPEVKDISTSKQPMKGKHRLPTFIVFKYWSN
jgi:uncharacterized protein YhdP